MPDTMRLGSTIRCVSTRYGKKVAETAVTRMTQCESRHIRKNRVTKSRRSPQTRHKSLSHSNQGARRHQESNTTTLCWGKKGEITA
eukprot:3691385-Rhodomonas_salina.3